jgi:hypothetical protein
MKAKRTGPWLAGVLGVCAVAGMAQTGTDLRSRNRLLESELAVARTSGSYMVIDLSGKTVSLRARGMVLRSWEIGRSRLWGKRIPMKTLRLQAKSALGEPRRTNITPGKEEPERASQTATAPGDVDLGILELKDMPIHYDLVFEEGVHVSIKPRTRNLWARFINLTRSMSWYIGLPIKTVFRTIRKKPFTNISVVLSSEKAAQEIYWALLDGQRTIIVS